MDVLKDSYDNSKIHQIYGISRDSENYAVVFKSNELYCGRCDNKYTDIRNQWCGPCQRNILKENFTNWTSGDSVTDGFIQRRQLTINHHNDIIFEWIPYNHFAIINKKTNEGSYGT